MTAKNNHPELIEKLAEGIGNLTSSEEWQHYLDFQSKFHRYSFNIVLLIAAPMRAGSAVSAATVRTVPEIMTALRGAPGEPRAESRAAHHEVAPYWKWGSAGILAELASIHGIEFLDPSRPGPPLRA